VAPRRHDHLRRREDLRARGLGSASARRTRASAASAPSAPAAPSRLLRLLRMARRARPRDREDGHRGRRVRPAREAARRQQRRRLMSELIIEWHDTPDGKLVSRSRSSRRHRHGVVAVKFSVFDVMDKGLYLGRCSKPQATSPSMFEDTDCSSSTATGRGRTTACSTDRQAVARGVKVALYPHGGHADRPRLRRPHRAAPGRRPPLRARPRQHRHRRPLRPRPPDRGARLALLPHRPVRPVETRTRSCSRRCIRTSRR
jgi:hypothetical protein